MYPLPSIPIPIPVPKPYTYTPAYPKVDRVLWRVVSARPPTPTPTSTPTSNPEPKRSLRTWKRRPTDVEDSS